MRPESRGSWHGHDPEMRLVSSRLPRARPHLAVFLFAAAPLLLPAPAAAADAAPIRGDCNSDGRRDISDVVFVINYLFHGGDVPRCLEKCDAQWMPEETGRAEPKIEVSDATSIIGAAFFGKPMLPLPAGACDASTPPPPPPDTTVYLFTWDAVGSDGASEIPAGYRLYVRERLGWSHSSYSLVKQVKGETSAVVDHDELPLPPDGAAYCFSVTAFDLEGNESAHSDEVEVVW